jgi:antitoxin PrlF
MTIEHEAISTVTAKGQTTVPKAVRQALGVEPGGRIAFRVTENGVTLHRVDEGDEDPVVTRFLDVLAADMLKRPQALQTLPPALAARIQDLVDGVEDDPDAPIGGAVDL